MKVLVISPHPDDEAIGCGGSVCKHVHDGDDVAVLHLTSGELGCPGASPDEAGARREAEAGVTSQVLHTQAVVFWREPDGALGASQGLIDRLAAFLGETRPDRIYAPHFGEAHPDHAAAAMIVQGALRRNGGGPECLMYEVWTPLAEPDVIMDITAHAGEKRAAIRTHVSQWYNGFDEAALALNRFRGLLGGPNMMYAEAFRRMVP